MQAAYALLLERLGPSDAAAQAGDAAQRPRVAPPPWSGPSAGLSEAVLGRALLVEVYRTGMLPAGSPLTQLPARLTPGRLLDLAPPAAVEELLQFAALAGARLLPVLLERSNRGPTYRGCSLSTAR